MKGFTYTNKALNNRLLSVVDLIYAGKIMNAVAQWDTGATSSCISSKVVHNLGLKAPFTTVEMLTPAGSKMVNCYYIDIVLPNDIFVKNVQVFETDIGKQNIDALIGMNVILTGDFAVSNYEGKTAFTFRSPSQAKIDFVREAELADLRIRVGTHGRGIRKHK